MTAKQRQQYVMEHKSQLMQVTYCRNCTYVAALVSFWHHDIPHVLNWNIGPELVIFLMKIENESTHNLLKLNCDKESSSQQK